MSGSVNVTADLAQFGHVQWGEAGRILLAMAEQRGPWDRIDEPTSIYFNMEFGMVFLAENEGSDAYAMNGDKLEEWLWCPVCSEDGFKKDLLEGLECCKSVANGTFWSEGDEYED